MALGSACWNGIRTNWIRTLIKLQIIKLISLMSIWDLLNVAPQDRTNLRFEYAGHVEHNMTYVQSICKLQHLNYCADVQIQVIPFRTKYTLCSRRVGLTH